MTNIITSKKFKKIAKKFFKKYPEIISRYKKTMHLIVLDPFHPSLRLHKLSGNLEGTYSVSITMQYRITLEFYIEGNSIILLNIGSHEEVY